MTKRLSALSLLDRSTIINTWSSVQLNEMTKDLSMWLDENLEGECYFNRIELRENRYIHRTLYFNNKEDLMLFKLTWL